MNIEIPVINDDKLKLYVNGEYKGDVNDAQVCKIRLDVMEYIIKTGDTSIVDTFYFIGHKDTNIEEMGEEIKITMDEFGNFSDLPWELQHVRRCMYKLIQLEREVKSQE